jgi:hypothetical protein
MVKTDQKDDPLKNRMVGHPTASNYRKYNLFSSLLDSIVNDQLSCFTTPITIKFA